MVLGITVYQINTLVKDKMVVLVEEVLTQQTLEETL